MVTDTPPPQASDQAAVDDVWPGRLRRSALLCSLIWASASGVESFLDRASQLIALGPSLVVPLGLALAAEPRGPQPLTFRIAAASVVLGAPCALVSLAVTPGRPAALLAVAWLVATLCVAFFGLRRLARRGLRPFEEVAVDVGMLYLPVGGIWMLASRASMPLLGFHEPVVSFTAAHFHFAGFAAPVIAGLVGRLVEGEGRGGEDDVAPLSGTSGEGRGGEGRRGWPRRLHGVSTAVVLMGIPLVAAGIQFSRALEMPAAVLLSAGMLILSFLLVRAGLARVSTFAPRAMLSGLLLLLSGLSLIFSMALAVLFTTTGSATRGSGVPLIPYSLMADLHGVANAIGFASLALVAMTLLPPPRRHGVLGGSWSRLLGRGKIGPDFFERAGAVDAGRSVRGQLASLDDFAWEGFSPGGVRPEVRAFYERTGEFGMVVTPTWFLPFRPLAPLFSALARRLLGQLELPTQKEDGDRIETRLFGVRDDVDGREDVRGYVRTYRDPGGAERSIFVAAYATHRAPGRLLLSAAFPLPRGALVGVLRFDDGPRPGGLTVSSFPASGEVLGDEGMFLLTPLGPLRLPLDERIEVWVDEAGQLRAEHRTWLLGLPCFVLEYAIHRQTGAASPG